MRKIRSIEDIKSGYVVKLRNGKLLMCMRYEQKNFLKAFVAKSGVPFVDVAKHYDGLKSIVHKNKDIIEVYGLSSNPFTCMDISTDYRPLLYQEEKPMKMTISEIEEKLGYKIEVVSEGKN